MPASDAGDFIVAAPDSPTLRTPFQAGVYHAPAVGAEAAIQNAINDLPSTGGTIRILPGNYSLNRVPDEVYCVLIDKSNVRILFEPGAVLKIADDQYPNASNVGHMFFLGDGTGSSRFENIVLAGPGKLVGNSANNPGDGNRARMALLKVQMNIDRGFYLGDGLRITDCIGAGIDGGGVTGGTGTLEGGIFHRLEVDNIQEGMRLTNWLGLRVSHCWIHDWTTQDGFEPIKNFTDCIVSNCIIDSGTATGGSAVDIVVAGASDTVENVTIRDCILTAEGSVVELGTSLGTAKGIKIVGGELRPAGSADGIRMGANVSNVLISGVEIDGSAGSSGNDGIAFTGASDRIVIRNCLIHDMTAKGFDGTNDPTGVSLHGCVFWGNTGVDITASGGADYDQAGNVSIS